MDQGKRAVVTGATSGIGEAIARRLAARPLHGGLPEWRRAGHTTESSAA